MKGRQVLSPVSIAIVVLAATLALLSACGAQTKEPAVATAGQTPAAQATKAPSGEPFVIALAGPITGENAQYGELLVKGAQLAVDQINAAGGIDGRQIKLLLADDQMDPKQSPLVAQRLAQDATVLAVIGHFASTNSLAAIPIYDRAGVPLLSHSSSTALSGISKWFFRLTITNDRQGRQLARFVDKLGAKRIAVMYGESEGGRTVEDPFEDELKTLGLEIITVETHQLSDKEYAAQITKVMAMNPDLAFCNCFFNDGALIVKQADEAGWRPTWLGCDSVGGPDFLKLAGPAAEGVYVSAFWDPSSQEPLAQKLVADYQAAYGILPEQYGAQAYSAVLIFAEALRNGARTREEIRKYLHEVGTTKGFALPSGYLKWDEKHDADIPMVFLQVQDGKWGPSTVQLAP